MPVLAYAELDLFGLIILFLFYLNQRRSGCHAQDDQIFNTVLLIGMGVLLLDGALWLLDGVIYPGGHAVLVALTTVSYILNPAIALFWLIYCDLRVFSDERGLKRRALVYGFPYLFNLMLAIANLFTMRVFSIDSANVYHRGPLFFLYFSVFYIYLLWAMILVLIRIKKCNFPSERRDLWFLVLFAFPPIIGGFLQLLFYGTSITWPSTVISFVIVYIYVLNRQISTDSLTGLNSRRMLKRFLDLRISATDTAASLFVIMLDANDFKMINDTCGHVAGDQALVQISEILKSLCNHQDHFLARLGGDEFIIVGYDPTGDVAETLKRKITESINAFNQTAGMPYSLSLSIGIAYLSDETVHTTDALLIAADRSMYKVKKQYHSTHQASLPENL